MWGSRSRLRKKVARVKPSGSLSRRVNSWRELENEDEGVGSETRVEGAR